MWLGSGAWVCTRIPLRATYAPTFTGWGEDATSKSARPQCWGHRGQRGEIQQLCLQLPAPSFPGPPPGRSRSLFLCPFVVLGTEPRAYAHSHLPLW